jgi:hypothetical protein
MGTGENTHTQDVFQEKLFGVEDCPDDEVKNVGMERSTLPLFRSGGDSKQNESHNKFFNKEFFLPSRPG